MMSQDDARKLISKHITFHGLCPVLVDRMRVVLVAFLVFEPDRTKKGRGCNSGPETSPEGGQSKRSYPK